MRIDAGVAGKLRGFVRVGPGRAFAAHVTDEADFALA